MLSAFPKPNIGSIINESKLLMSQNHGYKTTTEIPLAKPTCGAGGRHDLIDREVQGLSENYNHFFFFSLFFHRV